MFVRSDVVCPPSPIDDRCAAAELEGSSLLEISNEMVRLYKRAFGRGPTKARTLTAGPDAIVVVLEDVLTVAERNVLAFGGEERLREARQVLQDAIGPAVRSLVEQALGRRTRAYMTGVDARRAVAVTVVSLEAESGVGEPHLSGRLA